MQAKMKKRTNKKYHASYLKLASFLMLFIKKVIRENEAEAYDIPITYVDNLRCRVNIWIYPDRVELRISTVYPVVLELWNQYFACDMENITKEELASYLKKLIGALSNIRYSRLTDLFVESTHSFDMLYGIKNIQVGLDCSVCMEKCSHTTNCNHPLCVSCMTQMHTDVCPVCREIIES